MILVVVLAIAVIGGGAYVYFQAKQKSKTVMPPIQDPTLPADPTSDWKTYTSTKGGFSFRYDPDWKTTTCNGTDATVYLGPSAEALAACGSEFGGQMLIALREASQSPESGSITNPAEYMDYTRTAVTIDGATGFRAYGVQKYESEVGPPVGTVKIIYDLHKGSKVYEAAYFQYPTGATSQNLQADFDLMVKSLKFQ